MPCSTLVTRTPVSSTTRRLNGPSDLLSDQTELFKLFSDNPSFRNWLSEMVFSETYDD